MLLEMFVEDISEELRDKGLALFPNSAELIFRLRQIFADLEVIRSEGSASAYLRSVIDLEHLQQIIKEVAPNRKINKDTLIPILKDLIKMARENGTTLETEVREFYES